MNYSMASLLLLSVVLSYSLAWSDEPLVRVPKHRAADVAALRAMQPQLVPRIIWQTFETNLVAPVMAREGAGSWLKMNPEYEYHLVTNRARRAFIKREFSADVLKAYDALRHGAEKADLWRLAVILLRGGVYMDFDTACETPLREWIPAGASMVSGIGSRGDLHQWGIVAAPDHPLIRAAFERVVQNVLRGGGVEEEGVTSRFRGVVRALDAEGGGVMLRPPYKVLSLGGVEGRTGPAAFQSAIEAAIQLDPRLAQQLHVVEGGDVFGGRVRFRYGSDAQYFEDLARVGLRHYMAPEPAAGDGGENVEFTRSVSQLRAAVEQGGAGATAAVHHELAARLSGEVRGSRRKSWPAKRRLLIEALEMHRRATALAPRNATMLSSFGRAQVQAGKDAEARRSFERALEIAPEDTVSMYRLANVLTRQAKRGVEEDEVASAALLLRARELLAAVLVVEPSNVDVLNNLGVMEKNVGAFAKAIPLLRRALRLTPKSASPMYNLAHALLLAGSDNDALRTYRGAVAASPKHAGVFPELLARMRAADAAAVRDLEL